VDESLASEFRRKFGRGVVAAGRGRNLDIEAVCRGQLEASGIDAGGIFSWSACTCCGEGFFSYRAAGGRTGRQAGVVAIR
jgi:copper oxidase (laccase) domain-containing protein